MPDKTLFTSPSRPLSLVRTVAAVALAGVIVSGLIVGLAGWTREWAWSSLTVVVATALSLPPLVWGVARIAAAGPQQAMLAWMVSGFVRMPVVVIGCLGGVWYGLAPLPTVLTTMTLYLLTLGAEAWTVGRSLWGTAAPAKRDADV